MKNKAKTMKEVINECATSIDCEIVSIDFVHEHNMRILRIIARKNPTLTIEDASRLNKLISDELDNYDFIEDQYYLEVSSEGIEKELKEDKDIKDSIGEYICIRLYKKVFGKKEFYGYLLNVTDDSLTLDVGDKEDLTFNRKIISKIRLAINFQEEE